MTNAALDSDLVETVDQALALVRRHFTEAELAQITATNDPLPSLLEQCEIACAALRGPEPLRTIHHFACTGGTLISKVVAALPNTEVLSELDPLSTVQLNSDQPRFAPTDVILALRGCLRGVDDETLISTFLAGLAAAKQGIEARGGHLVVRDHAHSQFCVSGVDPHARPTLHELLSDRFELQSILTVRHPLDSFLSLLANSWGHFEPVTLEEYCRRYRLFLDRYVRVPVVRYEDFVEAPEETGRRLADLLGLRWMPLATDVLEIVKMSGDSGRRSAEISHRPRRKPPEWVDAERQESFSYRDVCDQFGYDP